MASPQRRWVNCPISVCSVLSSHSYDWLFPLFKILVEQYAKEEKWRERVRFGPICSMRSMAWPNIYDKIGPMFLIEGRTVSSFLLELWPNISEK